MVPVLLVFLCQIEFHIEKHKLKGGTAKRVSAEKLFFRETHFFVS